MTINIDDPSHLARLLREARRYEALAADSGLLVWAMDPELRPTGRNVAWERYTGLSHDEYRDLGWLESIRGADGERCLREIARHVPREEPFTLEVAIRRSDGVFRRHVIRAIPVRNESGVLIEWVGTATDVEDQLVAIDALHAMDERLRLTYEAARVGTWEWFPARGELRWSAEMYRMLGLEPGALQPSVEAWMAAIHPDDVEATTSHWVRAQEEAESLTQEFRIQRPDGSVRWVLSRASMIRDASGQVFRVLGLNMDVTERRAMEEQMASALAEHRELHERLLALTDGAEPVLRAASPEEVRAAICDLAARVLPADAYAVWSRDPSTSTWQIETSRGLGFRFVEERFQAAETLFTEPFVADSLDHEWLTHRAAAYRNEGIQSLIAVPLPIGGVRRATIVAYYRTPHITSRAERQVAVALGHLAAAALANAEARLRQELLRAEAERHSRRMAFLAEASALFSTLDYEESFRKLAELSVPSLADWCTIDVEREGRLVRVAVAHADRDKQRLVEQLHARAGILDDSTSIGRVLHTGQAEIFETIGEDHLIALSRDAEDLATLRRLSLRSAIVVPLSARGRTLGVLTLVSSTDGRRYEHSDLNFVELVARRAAMVIDNARLYEDARRANQAKDEFLTVLSHELRTPLNAIMGWTQVLLTSSRPAGSDAPIARGLAIIQRNAKLQAELVEGLLDVARVATGGLPLSRTIVDVAELVAAVIEEARPSATERGLQLTLTVRPGECRVSADPHRLHQILSNLLSNALKFTERGGVEVRLGPSDDWCEIEVADTGVGIAADFLPHVFERFRQADSSSTRRHGGLGLGLWLVHELVKAHGGTIRARSDGPGRGSTFTILLPRPRP